jgi:hypothetical protein
MAMNRQISIIDQALSIPSRTPVDWKFLSWAAVSTAPAKSEARFDGGQHATWIQVLTGTQVVFIRDDEGYNTPSQSFTPAALENKWNSIVLQPGHML